MKRLPLAALPLLALPLFAADPPAQQLPISDEARRIHESAIVIDGHNDLPWNLRDRKDRSFQSFDLRRDLSKTTKLHTDIPRLRAGGVGAQFWSAWVPVETAHSGTAVKTTLEQIDVIHRMIQTYPEAFELALTADDIVRIHKSGKIASLIGLEGGHSIDNSLGVLRMLHRLGARYMTLTHSETIDWADSATDKPKSHGLSPFGEQVVAEMNRIGMFVDISHVSPETMKHALRVTRAPVIASHSSAYAVAQHPRNVPDDVLKLVAENGGVVMANFYPGFIVPEGARAMKDMFQAVRELKAKYPDEKQYDEAMREWRKEHPVPRGNVKLLVDHIEHIVQVAGIDHVGLGSDFDGIPTVPEGLDDVSRYPAITQELLNRGYKAEQIRKVLGENLLRAMRKMEEVARGTK
jgi:membrane dipeptidase